MGYVHGEFGVQSADSVLLGVPLALEVTNILEHRVVGVYWLTRLKTPIRTSRSIPDLASGWGLLLACALPRVWHCDQHAYVVFHQS